jgi:Lar family restriction alleviation protein
MSEPLPCPFCGAFGDDLHTATVDGGGKWGLIECGSCGARGPDVRTGYEDAPMWRDDAIAEWNRRVP